LHSCELRLRLYLSLREAVNDKDAVNIARAGNAQTWQPRNER